MSCRHFHISPNYIITDSTSQVIFGFANPVTVTDEEHFCWKIATALPTGTPSTYTALVTINGTNVPLLNKYGNPITVAELRRGTVYKGYYGASTPHVIFNNTPKTFNVGCNNVL